LKPAGDAGGGQYRPQTGASVGETRQLRVAGSANGLELPADQGDDVRIRSRDGSENLTSSSLSLDIANPDFDAFCYPVQQRLLFWDKASLARLKKRSRLLSN